MRAIFYVDGFNLYYRMLRERPQFKWLDPSALARQFIKAEHDLVRVNYYTARVSARAHDPDAPARQARYLSALSCRSEIVVHEGTFLISEPWMPLANPPAARPHGYIWNAPAPVVVRVVKSEEKGSDVNMGAHIVRDAYTDAFDVAYLLTNDSDLVEAVRIAVLEANKAVGLLIPVKYPTASLAAVASFQLHIRPGHLARSQFPDQLEMPSGLVLSRPDTWRVASDGTGAVTMS
jgi:uncharacterized LabA/DUF88 family protein